MDINSQKCMGCGATLKYNPETKNFKCEYCNSEYTISDIEKIQESSKVTTSSNEDDIKVSNGSESNKEYEGYVCPNCGAELITNENTVATSCVYCKSTAIVKNRIKGMLLPSKLIPFEKTKEDAIKAFKSCVNGKLFAPKEFSDIKNLNEVTGVYVPFWLYDSITNCDYEANATKVSTWIAGEYNYTKTDTFKVLRSGNMEFEKVPCDSSSKFEDDLMDSIEPYDYGKLVDFNEAYLSGFLAEKFDVTKEDASKRMETRVTNSAINEMRNSIFGYTSVIPIVQNVNIKKGNIDYVMLPVYMLNIKYKNLNDYLTNNPVLEYKENDYHLLPDLDKAIKYLIDKKESNCDKELGLYWSNLCDVMINDAFGTSHREHASNCGIMANKPSCIGFLIEKEYKYIRDGLNNPKTPFTIILGGSKVSDKIGLIKNLIDKVDYLLIGGGMAYTFLYAKGINIGNSLLDSDNIEYCNDLLNKYPNKIILPIDHVVSDNIESNNYKVVDNIEDSFIGLDIGPKTIKLFESYLNKTKTLVWNGPVGMFENINFSKGTKSLCEIIKKLKIYSIVGGGDTASAVINLGYKDSFSHISTGGGASLELLEGKEMPFEKYVK